MGLPVRVVCESCLNSVECSQEDAPGVAPICPYCRLPIHLDRGTDSSTADGSDSPTVPTSLVGPALRVAIGPETGGPGRIGRFVIREPLGEGGYGQVFRAYDPHLDREVALKVLKPNRLGEKAMERFLREARAAARLDHPHIVGLHDAGREGDRCWIAYQLVAGRTLSAVRDADRLPIDRSVRLVRDLSDALHHAHGRGVFHRDIKPANVLVDAAGRARLTDFGLARRNDVDSDLTREGTILGTPQYMSPEAAAGRAHEADARSDVYSLGVILYELICGRRPSDTPSGAPLWRAIAQSTPPTPRTLDRAVPAALDRICMKALALDPADRFADAGLFARELDQYLSKRPVPRPLRPLRPARPRRAARIKLAAGIALAVVAVGGVFGMLNGRGPDRSKLDPGSRLSPVRSTDTARSDAVVVALDAANADPSKAMENIVILSQDTDKGDTAGTTAVATPESVGGSPLDETSHVTLKPVAPSAESTPLINQFVVNKTSKIYHKSDCPSRPSLGKSLWYSTLEEAREHGTKACETCLKEEYLRSLLGSSPR